MVPVPLRDGGDGSAARAARRHVDAGLVVERRQRDGVLLASHEIAEHRDEIRAVLELRELLGHSYSLLRIFLFVKILFRISSYFSNCKNTKFIFLYEISVINII